MAQPKPPVRYIGFALLASSQAGFASHGTASGRSYTFLEAPFTQELVGTHGDFFGGIAFAPDGTFLCLPIVDTNQLLATWQTKVFELLVAAGEIDQQTVDQMRSWPHSGFSVDN